MDGKPAPGGMFEIPSRQVTVPAGGTAGTTVTGDTRVGGERKPAGNGWTRINGRGRDHTADVGDSDGEVTVRLPKGSYALTGILNGEAEPAADSYFCARRVHHRRPAQGPRQNQLHGGDTPRNSGRRCPRCCAGGPAFRARSVSLRAELNDRDGNTLVRTVERAYLAVR
ncbi:hypothetical protein QF037_008677 [Streptomyces canus]|uniref:hypothetical protein n=1 Tax=Streptomyces canus TaxID=58343 RepID=UPI00277FB45A|nr:hypothetical protein [Streptomyces canus]MDQ0604332.1 hypothetical protein [Streptomyces canus]